LPEAQSFRNEEQIMSRLTDVGIETADQLLPQPRTGESTDSGEIDRSLGAVVREIGYSLAGWLFFVVAVQLLLHGSHLLRT
jgi:hypothetical protein